MKTFDQLTEAQQAKAIEKVSGRILMHIVDGSMRFNDKLNQDDFHARIDKAMEKASAMKTPWFAGEYVMAACREDIEGMARCEAEASLYSQYNENVINGIA